MNCVAIGRNYPRTGVLTLDHLNCLSLRHSFRDSKINRIALRVRTVPRVGQPLGYQRLLMLLRPKSAGRDQTQALQCAERVKVSAET